MKSIDLKRIIEVPLMHGMEWSGMENLDGW
jgi:hypothetical protein